MTETRRTGTGRQALLAAWVVAIMGVGCGGEPPPNPTPSPPPSQGTPQPEPAPVPSLCPPVAAQQSDVDCSRVGRIALARTKPHLGTGVHMTLRLEGADGAPLDASTYDQCLQLLHPASCSELDLETQTETHPSDGALTALLVAPGTSAESAARARAVTEALLATRPASERIAIYRWGESVRQVSNFTRDRALATRLARRGLLEATEKPVLPVEAVAAVRGRLLELARGTFSGVRAIVVVAPELTLDERPASVPGLPGAPGALDVDDTVTIWGVAQGAALGQPGVVALQEDPAATASSLSDAVTAHVDAGLVHLSWCGNGSSRAVLFQSYDSAAELLVQTPEPLPEEGHMQCSLEGLRQPRAYPERIEMVFTNEAQRQVYYDRVASLSKDDFDVMVRLWPDGPLAAADAKLRGHSSLECTRKSFALDFDGPAPRRLMPDSATDEFYLISMCEDDRYLSNRTAFTLLSKLGLFPLKFRFIELYLDEAHGGLYMLVERSKDELLRDNGIMRGIVRRNADLEDEEPEGKYGYVNDQQALDDYKAFMSAVEQAPAGEVLETLQANMDIDQYMRWVAVMTLLGNGDYSDEAYFVSTESIDGTLEPVDSYSIMAWDPENLFQPCHHDGQYAIEDPHGLLHCAEAQIDHTMFADPEVYAHYVGVLESVLDTVTQEQVEAAIDDTQALLDGYFMDDELRAAMVEIIEVNPDAATYEGIMADVEQRRVQMKTDFAANQTRLRQAIEDWKAQQN